MKYPLFSVVTLTTDLPQFGFKKGDVATVVEFVEKNQNEENSYILEFFDSDGDTIDVIGVLESCISKPQPHAVVNYRVLEKVA